MLINAINYQYKTNFCSSRYKVLDDAGMVINCHYTNLNRADVDWKKFVKLLDQRFAKQNKVKINIFGCSDGSDAYTLALCLKKYLGARADKFSIEASDISADMIDTANKGHIMLHSKDIEFLKDVDGEIYFLRDYATPVETARGVDLYRHQVRQDLRKMVNFSVKDVRKEAKTHDFSNEVFMFRNGWTFMDIDSQNQTINDLSKNCNEKTLFMIGQSDLFKSNACEIFQKNGFNGIKSDVFTSAETDYPSKSIGIPKEKSTFPEFILFEKA